MFTQKLNVMKCHLLHCLLAERLICLPSAQVVLSGGGNVSYLLVQSLPWINVPSAVVSVMRLPCSALAETAQSA